MKNLTIYLLRLSILLLGSTVLSIPHTALACTCSELFTPPCAAFQRADLVFTGTLEQITDSATKDVVPHVLARFTVEGIYKGKPSKSITLDLGVGECYPKLEINRKYFVYAHSSSFGKVELRQCGRTRPLEVADADLEYVRSLATSRPEMSVMGSLPSLTDEEFRQFRATITGPHGSIDADLATKGFYQARVTEPGRYTIRLVFPFAAKVYATPDMTVVASSATTIEYAVSLQNGQCDYREVNLAKLEGTATISGLVVGQDGAPVADLLLQLYPYAPGQKFVSLKQKLARTDKEGRYTFKEIAEGRYVLGVNLEEDLPALGTPYPKTFFPASSSLDRATVIDIKAHQQLSINQFQLPGKLIEGRIRGKLVWGDGAPVVKPSADPPGLMQAILYVLSPTEPQKVVSLGSNELDHNGNFTLVGYEGYCYVIHAHAFKEEEKPFHSKHVKVGMTGNPEFVTLVLSIPGKGEDQTEIRNELLKECPLVER